MKSLVDLLADLVHDCARRSGAPLWRDVETLRARAQHEGDSFITITLPAFCRDFERSLDIGRIAPGAFQSFGKTRAGIPEFLQGLLCNVFGPDATLLATPSTECVKLIRQICLFGKKLLRPCSPEREEKVVADYRQCDDDIVACPDSQLYRNFKRVARIIFSSTDLLGTGWKAGVIPQHGPGATQERISGNQKWRFLTWPRRLHDVGFTHTYFGLSRENVAPDDTDFEPRVIEPEDEAPVRVTLVPKTLKAPRVIAVEPVVMQYAQQGLRRVLTRQIEECRYTAGRVNFRDQTVNQGLVLTRTASGDIATLDMSEASDRVSLSHVYDMLESVPEFRAWVLACRSTRAELPSGDIIPLKKFASMGSALCFPMEAMVFFTSIIASRLSRAGVFPSTRSVYEFSRDVFVYGDDLIVPAGEAPAVCEDLEAFGLKVNRHKSFWTGKFRESCGMDVYDNSQVTPVYLRRDPPSGSEDISGILSCIATANQLLQAGFWKAGTALREAVHAVMGHLPHVPRDSPALGWYDYSEVVPRQRWNRDLQRLESRCWVVTPSTRPDPLDGYPALAKCFRLIGLSDKVDPEHLEVSPRAYALTLKRRWVPLCM